MKSPKILTDHGLSTFVNEMRFRTLNVPLTKISLNELSWHFDMAVWEKDGTDDWNLTPRQVINHVEGSAEHRAKVDAADIQYPIIVTRYKHRYVILDGVHRLVKTYEQGLDHISAKVIPQNILKYRDTSGIKNLFRGALGRRTFALRIVTLYAVLLVFVVAFRIIAQGILDLPAEQYTKLLHVWGAGVVMGLNIIAAPFIVRRLHDIGWRAEVVAITYISPVLSLVGGHVSIPYGLVLKNVMSALSGILFLILLLKKGRYSQTLSLKDKTEVKS